MDMQSIAALYAPMLGQAASGRPDARGATSRMDSMFLATLLRASHLFGSQGGHGGPTAELLNGILPQILANDLVTRHQGIFGQMALSANSLPSSGGEK